MRRFTFVRIFFLQIFPSICENGIKNKNELAADILRSPHVWIQNSQPKCAWTLIPPRLQEIVLSFETCQQTTLNDRHAAFVLIHESTHHFPELNSSRWSDAEIEMRSDAIASAILAAAEAAVVKGTPVWKGLPLSKAPAPRSHHSANLVNSNTVSIFAGCEHERGVPFVCSATLTIWLSSTPTHSNGKK